MGKSVIFGVCADVHHEIGYDQCDRMKKFINEANERKVDFIIQLGDFIRQKEFGVPFIDIWNQFEGPKYHVLGNHDSETVPKEEMMEFIGMKEKYYSFDVGDYHFVVLDTNYFRVGDKYYDFCKKDYRDGYLNWQIPPEQLEWFAEDIRKTDKRCFVFTHAPIASGDFTIDNKYAFMDVVFVENQRCGFNKVTMVLSGHAHSDFYEFKSGVHYLLVNSMDHNLVLPTYIEKARTVDAVVEDYGYIRQKAFYKEPLYCFVRLKENGLIQVLGKQSEYVGFSPIEVGWERNCSPQISYRELWMNGVGPF